MPWRARFRRWLDRWLAPAAERSAGISAGPPPARRRAQRQDGRALRLALQGGGAHGAFTWGVLDRLLEEPGLTFPQITGASAGALNGAMLVSGHARGGPAGAREALAELWEGSARSAR